MSSSSQIVNEVFHYRCVITKRLQTLINNSLLKISEGFSDFML